MTIAKIKRFIKKQWIDFLTKWYVEKHPLVSIDSRKFGYFAIGYKPIIKDVFHYSNGMSLVLLRAPSAVDFSQVNYPRKGFFPFGFEKEHSRLLVTESQPEIGEEFDTVSDSALVKHAIVFDGIADIELVNVNGIYRLHVVVKKESSTHSVVFEVRYRKLKFTKTDIFYMRKVKDVPYAFTPYA